MRKYTIDNSSGKQCYNQRIFSEPHCTETEYDLTCYELPHLWKCYAEIKCIQQLDSNWAPVLNRSECSLLPGNSDAVSDLRSFP